MSNLPPSSSPTPPPPKSQGKIAQLCALVFIIVGVVVYQSVAPKFFPRPPGGGINLTQVLGAALVGGICGALGGVIGKLIEGLRK